MSGQNLRIISACICCVGSVVSPRTAPPGALTAQDVEVLTTTLHAFLHDHYPRLQPAQTTIVLPECTGDSPKSGGFGTAVGDEETSHLLVHLRERNRQPFQLTKTVVAGDVLLMSREQAAIDSSTTASGRTAYAGMWLPGYSDDGNEAVVYAWSAGSDTEYGLDMFGVLYYLRRSEDGWVACGYREVWRT